MHSLFYIYNIFNNFIIKNNERNNKKCIPRLRRVATCDSNGHIFVLFVRDRVCITCNPIFILFFFQINKKIKKYKIII